MQTIRVVHGSFMFVAWGVATPLGAFLARFKSPRDREVWTTVHCSACHTCVVELIGPLALYHGDVLRLATRVPPH